MLRRLALVLPALILAGCGASEAQAPTDKAQRLQERIARAQAAADQPPRVTRHRLEQGELLVTETRTASPYGGLDVQRCFIWRDAEYHSASITCPGEAETAPLQGPPPDPLYRP